MSKKQSMLVVTARISQTSAQGIRYFNLFNNLANRFNIIHLTYSKSSFTLDYCKNIEVKSNFEKVLPIIFIRIIRHSIRRIFFPDEYVFGLFLYKRAIKSILIQNEIKNVVVCLTPFSFIKLAKYIKNINPQINVVADFSDPFSANAEFTNLPQKRIKAEKFEWKYLHYFDKVVVLNEKIKEYYCKQGFTNAITIEQGVNKLFVTNVNKANYSEPFKLVYAGGFYRDFRDPTKLFDAIKKCGAKVEIHVYGGKSKTSKDFSRYKFVYSHPHVPHNDLITAYINAHLLIVIDNFYGIQVPGKTLECFSFNRPVLIIYENEDSPTLDYFSNSSGIYKVRNEVELIEEKVLEIIRDYNQIVKRFNPEEYLWESLTKKYLNMVIRKL